MATLYKADGTIEEVKPAGGRKKFTLKELQAFVGGDLDTVPMHRLNEPHTGKMLFFDEEGKLRKKPINRAATSIYQFGYQDPIVGDAILCTTKEVE